MTLPQVAELTEYWSQNPPAHIVLMAMATRGKHKQSPAQTPSDDIGVFLGLGKNSGPKKGVVSMDHLKGSRS